MTLSNRTTRVALKLAVFAASLAPLAAETWTLFNSHIARGSTRALERTTGDWSIVFLCLTLAVTPLRRLTSWHVLIRFRRMLGLFAFFYGMVHFFTYLVLDRFSWLDFPDGLVSGAAALGFARSTGRDILVRPFLAIGFAALLIMVPLAVTSTAGMIRRLGGRRWRRLHRLVYVVAIGGLLHHWWPLADRFRLDTYGALIATAIMLRIYWARLRALRLASLRQ